MEKEKTYYTKEHLFLRSERIEVNYFPGLDLNVPTPEEWEKEKQEAEERAENF